MTNTTPFDSIIFGNMSIAHRKEIMPIFLKSAGSSLENLNDAFTQNNIKDTGFFAHKLAGSAAVVGAKELENLARELEMLTMANTMPPENKIDTLNQLFSLAKEFIDKELHLTT